MQVGRLFQEVSGGHFTERIAPWLMQAAPFAGVDRLPFQQALQSAVRDKRKVCLPSVGTALCACQLFLMHCKSMPCTDESAGLNVLSIETRHFKKARIQTYKRTYAM